MRYTKELVGSAIAVAVLLLPAGAGAAERCEAPPGTAGIDQYCENVPDARGERGSGTGPPAGGSLDRRTARALEEGGRDGEGVLRLSPSAVRERPARGSGAEAEGREHSGSPIDGLGSALESGATAGQGFVWLLVAAALGMGAIAWIRYRRGSRA